MLHKFIFIRIFDSIKLKAGIWYIQNNAMLFLVLFLLKFSRIYGGKSCDMLVVVDETLFVSFNRDVGTDVEKGFSGNHLFKVYVLMKGLA